MREFALGIMAAFLVVATITDGSCSPNGAATCEAAAAVSVRSLLATDDAARLGETVCVTGRLENIGTNYFTDLRVVLRDPDSAAAGFVYVRPWLPLELPPAPAGGPKQRPATLSEYLGKNVRLLAVYSRGPLKHVGEVELLEVVAAEVLE